MWTSRLRALFHDRVDAGNQLAAKLSHYKNKEDTVVLGLPRGGIVVAAEVARCLGLPLDLVVPRKIGCPSNPEFALGALTEDGHILLNRKDLGILGLTEEDLRGTIERETAEAQRRLRVYRAGMPPREFANKTVLVVDDGIATGSTMMASIQAVRARNAARVVVAVPVMPLDRKAKFERACDELVTVAARPDFSAVGQFYSVFDQTEDSEVIRLMQELNAAKLHPSASVAAEDMHSTSAGGEAPKRLQDPTDASSPQPA